MSDDKIRLGGMALLNGVLVHGPNSWACAVRTRDGELKVAAEYKRLRANKVESALLRGPARIAEVFAVLPRIRGALPEPRLPFQRVSVPAARAPAHLRGAARAAAQLGAVGAATEIFGWMVRNPEKALSRALARPGHELQHRLATAEPTPAQLEVAEAALAACLKLEREAD